MAAKKSFGDWFKEKQQQQPSENEAATEQSEMNWKFWETSSEKKVDEGDDGETGSLLPTFIRNAGGTSSEENEGAFWKGMSRSTRFKAFVGLVISSSMFFGLAFTFVPLVMIRPSKFALCFTLGSMCFMGSFAMLRGPMAQLRNMCAKDRLPFTSIYVGSMVLTLYAALVARSYILVVLFSSLQIMALLWYFISYIPGGSAGLAMFTKAMVKTGKVLFAPCLKGMAEGCSLLFKMRG